MQNYLYWNNLCKFFFAIWRIFAKLILGHFYFNKLQKVPYRTSQHIVTFIVGEISLLIVNFRKSLEILYIATYLLT